MNKLKTRLCLIFKSYGLYFLIGIMCGIVGTLFAKCIALVTSIRTQHSYLLYFLPVAALVSVGAYKLFKVSGMGTNEVIKNTYGNDTVSPLLAPAVFIGSVISHLFGASVGREGAALQLGGGISAYLGLKLKLANEEKRIITFCGMAGLFSAVFGTPFAAFAFALEIVFVGHIYYKAILPSFISSFAAYFTAALLGAHTERFNLKNIPEINFSIIWKIIVIAMLCALISMLFCYAIKYSERIFKKLFKNEYIRIASGGVIIVLLTLISGSTDYNGAGIDVIEKLFDEGSFKPEAFLLKMLFTAVAVGAGFKGGEIIPTLFIGATFGGLAGTFLGLTPDFSAAIGITALFCGVTNCPIASIFLALEMFSGKGFFYVALTALISFLLSGRVSLYSAQKTEGFKDLF